MTRAKFYATYPSDETPAYMQAPHSGSGIPQPPRLGIFHSSLQTDSIRASWNPPTGEVGDCSLKPTCRHGTRFPESPNRQGWGFFTLAKKEAAHTAAKRKPGDASSRVLANEVSDWSERSPTFPGWGFRNARSVPA